NIKEHQRARANAKRALAANPGTAAWWSLANALLGLKRYEQAIVCYEKAFAFEPDNSSIWRRRNAAFAALGKKSELPKVALNPKDADGWAVLAGVFALSYRFPEASEASDRALKLDPGHVSATRIGIHSR